MSVILDALKRVQEENRRRDTSPESSESPVARTSNALLRRLASPTDGGRERGESRLPQLSPVVWITLAGFTVVVMTVLGMWLLQPSYTGPRANDGRPLLSELTSGGQSPSQLPVSTEPHSSGIQESFGTNRGPGAEDPSAAGVLRELASQPGPGGAADDMSDLSANLPEAAAGSTASSDSESESAGVLRLEVASEGRNASGDSTPRGGSSMDPNGGPAAGSAPAAATPQQPAWLPSGANPGVRAEPQPTGRSSTPNRLVDPGVKAAFSEAVALQKAGDLGRAENSYRRALKFDPHNAKVNANLGVLYESQNRLQLAESHLRKAIDVEPNNANAHNNLGVVLYRSGAYDAAMIEFNRTLALDPRRLDAYTNKGLIFTRWGRFDDAERSFLQVLAIDPNNALAHYNLGLVYEETDQVERAIEHYYEFLLTGGHDHPEIATYLDGHLSWLEGRLNSSARPRD